MESIVTNKRYLNLLNRRETTAVRELLERYRLRVLIEQSRCYGGYANWRNPPYGTRLRVTPIGVIRR